MGNVKMEIYLNKRVCLMLCGGQEHRQTAGLVMLYSPE